MRRLGSFGALFLLLALACAQSAAAEEVKITSDTFGGLRARDIGPAVMSGRIAAIEAVPGDPLVIYVGAASGGVWKSIDSGTTFKPIFDDYTQSIGAIRVDPTNAKTIWVGTGETWVRNSVSVGTGVYKSTDGGDSWTAMGLPDSEHIAKIEVDPKHSDTVYVCATGHLWNANQERGVYKTTDGGKSWTRVLYVDVDTGCSDLAIDPQEPGILYAGLWQFRRYPDFFSSGGKGSGLYKTTDGGATWKRLTEGLPKGELGRVAVAVAPSRPSVVYTVVEAKKTALYRSDDTGASWAEVNSGFAVQARPFYFASLAVDPKDHNTVYKPGLTLGISTDGGKSVSNSMYSAGGYHGDIHPIWIDPRDPNVILMTTDGGLYISRDKAHHWSFVGSLPIAQYYHVSYDMHVPYNVYGGLQDNSSWKGPSRHVGGIQNKDWSNIGGGDGFWAFADPNDPDILYSMSQGGELVRVQESTGEIKDIKPYARAGEPELRFNWNAAVHLSPRDKGTVYFGAQYLYRSHNRGDSWERISPDLTTNDKQRLRQAQSGGLTTDNSTAENNATIYTIAESPQDHDVIWVGTDDGNVQVTRDAGKSWSNASGTMPGGAKGVWGSRVEPSPFDAATAFVTIDDHRRGDMRPYLFKTTDFGKTWSSLVTPEIEGFCWTVKQDLVNPNLVFLGTEFGLYISIDGGREWARFKGNLPKVAVHDMVIHPREHDLILATHGRGVYILDDLTPLRALAGETIAKDVAILPSRPGEQTVMASVGDWFSGDQEYVGRNPPEAAPIVYWLKKRHLFGDLKVEVYGADGKLISTIPGTKRVGLNRVEWPMRMKPPKFPPSTNLTFAFFGPRVPEGKYKIKLIKGKETVESEVVLVADPRNPHSVADRKAKSDSELELYRRLADLTYVVETTPGIRDAAKARAEKLGKGDALKGRLEKLGETTEKLRASLVATSEAGWLSGDEKLKEKLGNLFGAINRFEGRPTDSQLERKQILLDQLSKKELEFTALVDQDVKAVNAELVKQKREAISVPPKAEWEKKDQPPAGGAVLTGEGAEALFAAFPTLATAFETLSRSF